MKRIGAAALAAAAGAVLACASATGKPRPAPPEPDLRIWVPPIIHWPSGADRDVAFAIENGTHRTLEIPTADPAAARVAIYADAGEARACGVEPSARPPAGTVRLAPGDQLPVRVDLGEACDGLPPGEYRYELSYRAPRAAGGTLALATRYGTLLVHEPRRAARRPAAAPRPSTARGP